jgi:hypothetical protein
MSGGKGRESRRSPTKEGRGRSLATSALGGDRVTKKKAVTEVSKPPRPAGMQTMGEQVYQQLRQAILDEPLPPAPRSA